MKHKTVKDLRKAVEDRQKNNDKTIIEMEGMQFNVDYAKYLLQFLVIKKIHEDTPLMEILVKSGN